MKNKTLLGSVTVLSALVFAACGNSTKETKETTLRLALQRRIFCLKVGNKKEFIGFLCLIHDINVSLQIESYSRY